MRLFSRVQMSVVISKDRAGCIQFFTPRELPGAIWESGSPWTGQEEIGI